jgi:hypothetical protein
MNTEELAQTWLWLHTSDECGTWPAAVSRLIAGALHVSLM